MAFKRKGRVRVPAHLNPGGGERMRDDNPTAKILIAKGISIMELSRRVKIDRRKVSAYMRGELPWSKIALRRIALELQVEPRMLTGEVPLPGVRDGHPSQRQ